MNGPYTAYCTKYRCGFDIWEPVRSNSKLADILSAFSAPNPPSNGDAPSIWTLDELFLLPKARLKYYKKLYGRLLKSTTPGRSDHRLLIGALDTLDGLLNTLESRSSVNVANPANVIASPVPVNIPTPLSLTPAPVQLAVKDETVVDLGTQVVNRNHSKADDHPPPNIDINPESESSSPRGSSVSGG